MSTLDIARFREVVGHFATGVVVVSASGERGPVGFTCQSFGSLSIDPILVSFSARTDSTSWPQIARVGRLAINILSEHQEALARAFATSSSDKFAGVSYEIGRGGAPLLNNALAHLEGVVLSVSAHGDHDIVVVAVDYIESFDGAPLIYYRGGFGTFTS